jgi:hypothetical protein
MVMALQWNRGGTVDRGAGSAKDLLDKSFDTIWARRDEFDPVTESLFEKISHRNAGDTFKIGNVGISHPLPHRNDDTQPLPFSQAAPGFSKEVTLYSYRSAARVTDTIVQTQRFPRALQMVNGLVTGPRRLMEYQRTAIFDGAFAGTDGSDSLALCHDSHPHENPEAGTWDNLLTGPLTHGNLQAARLLMRQMKNEQGFPEPLVPKMLMVPPALEQKATELTVAVMNPETAINQPNVLIRSLNVLVNPFLESATAWFLIGDLTGEERGLFVVEAIPLNVKDCKPSENPDIIWAKRTKVMHAVAFTRTKNIVGSAGT